MYKITQVQTSDLHNAEHETIKQDDVCELVKSKKHTHEYNSLFSVKVPPYQGSPYLLSLLLFALHLLQMSLPALQADPLLFGILTLVLSGLHGL